MKRSRYLMNVQHKLCESFRRTDWNVKDYVTMKNGKLATQGICSVYGTKMFKKGK
jgi:hypothetical protein